MPTEQHFDCADTDYTKKQDLVAPTLRYTNFFLRLVRLICMACLN